MTIETDGRRRRGNASRQAVLDRIGFLQDIYGQGVTFRSLSNTLVNGVPIETGQTNVNIVDPSTYKTALFRLDFKMGSSDNLTARVSYNGRVDNDAISNCFFGPTFCGSQDLKDTNVALSQTHTFNANLLNEARVSLVKRDLLFPENDPTSPTATITGLFQIGGHRVPSSASPSRPIPGERRGILMLPGLIEQ